MDEGWTDVGVDGLFGWVEGEWTRDGWMQVWMGWCEKVKPFSLPARDCSIGVFEMVPPGTCYGLTGHDWSTWD